MAVKDAFENMQEKEPKPISRHVSGREVPYVTITIHT
jgi:hypothetical protein